MLPIFEFCDRCDATLSSAELAAGMRCDQFLCDHCANAAVHVEPGQSQEVNQGGGEVAHPQGGLFQAASVEDVPLVEAKSLFEAALAKAAKADPADAPFPLTGEAAVIWHKAQASALQWVLEMLP